MLTFIRNPQPISSIAFGASAVSSTASITIPAGAAIGDLAIFADFAVNAGSVPAAVTPSGWTKRGNMETGGGNSRLVVFSKILVAGDPGLSITGMDGDVSDQKIIFTFSPNARASVLNFGFEAVEGQNGDPADQTVTAGAGHAPLVVLGFAACTDAVGAFNAETPAFTAKTTQGNLIAGYRIYNSAPANHTVGMADLGARNALSSCYVEVS